MQPEQPNNQPQSAQPTGNNLPPSPGADFIPPSGQPGHTAAQPYVTPNQTTPIQTSTTPTNRPTTPVSPPAQPVKESAKWYQNNIFSYIVLFGSAICLALLINAFVLQSYVVVGTSMVPTLQDGNRLFVNKTPVTWHKVFGGEYLPERGNIIIFNAPIKITEDGVPADQLIKRVIGLPGERVVVKNKKITIYNERFPDGFNPDSASYGKNLAPTAGDVDITVPEGFVFVCGDNRVPGGSFDSRSELGPIPIKNIVGRLALRYMPLSEVDSF